MPYATKDVGKLVRFVPFKD